MYIMVAGAKILVAVVAAALTTAKNGVLSCSLPSHQSGSSLCSSSATDSTTDDSTLISHHGSSWKQHTKPPPCDPSIGSSSCSTSLLSSLPFGATPFLKPNFIPISSYQGSVPTLQTSPPVASVYSLAHLNNLIKLMITFLKVFPSICSTAGLHGSKSTFMPLCSTLAPTSTIDKNTAGNTGLIGSKLTSMPPITLFTPKLDDKAVRPVLKPPTIIPQHTNPCAPSLGSGFGLPSVLPSSLSCGSFSLPKGTAVSGEVPLSTSKTNIEIISTSTLAPASGKVSELTSEASSPTVPEEFPALSPIPNTSDTTSVPVMLSGHNQAILNQIIKMILSPKPTPHKPTSQTPSLPIVSTHFSSKKNKSSIPSSVQKPLSKLSICSTPLNLSFCASSLPHLSTSGSVTPPLTPSLEPTFTPSVPYGYNPAFIKLLFKQLFSHLPSLPPPLPSPTSASQSMLNITTAASPNISNPLPTPTSNNQSSNLYSNASSNKFPDLIPSPSQVPTTTPSKPLLDNNVNCTNSYYTNTLVTPPAIPSKTPSLRPCLSSLNFHLLPVQNTPQKPAFVPNQIDPCKSSGVFPSDLLGKFLSLTPDTTQKSPGQIPVSDTPLPVSKPTLGSVEMTTPAETVPKPSATSFPCSSPPSFSSTPCHLKHLRLHSPHTPAHMTYPPHLAHSPHTPHKPRPPHLPHSPHLSIRCPLSAASMLGTGCKH